MEEFQVLIMVLIASLRDHANLVRHTAYGPVRKEQADSIRRRAKFVKAHITEVEEGFVSATERQSEQMLEMMVWSEKVVRVFQENDDQSELGELLRDMQAMRKKLTPEIGSNEAGIVLSVRTSFRQYREELDKIIESLEGV